MIDKLTSSYRPAGITETEQPQPKSNTTTQESSEKTSSSSVVQDSKLAYSKLGESAFSSSVQRAALDAALNVNATKAPETSAPVGAPPVAGETAGTGKALKLGDNGSEVESFQIHLNIWRRENGLPDIAASGVFTKETEDAVKEFQRLKNLKPDGVANEATTELIDMETSEYFKELDSEVRDTIRNAYSAVQNDPQGRDNLLKVVHERQFRYLISPDAQKATIHGFMQDPSNKNMPEFIKRATVDVAILEKDLNYQGLSGEIKQEALNTMFFKMINGGLAVGSKNNVLADLVSDPNFAKLPVSQQRQMIQTVSANQDAFTAHSFVGLLKDRRFQELDPATQAKVIDIAHNNTIFANTKDQWPEMNDVDTLRDLVNSKRFQEASEEERNAMLEAERKTIPYALGEN